MRSKRRHGVCRFATLMAAIVGSVATGVHTSPALGEECVPQWSDPFGSGVNGSILAAVEHNGDLIVGGTFTAVNGAPANLVARWDGSSWHRMGFGLTSQIVCPANFPQPANVAALTVWNGDLIAAGIFTESGDQPLGSVARWDGQSWLPFSGPGSDPGCWIEDLTVWNGDLIVAGRFAPFVTTEGVSIERLARWDGEAWHKFGNGHFHRPDPGNGLVLAAVEWNGDLIVGGDFTHVDGLLVNRIARWDGEQWHSMNQGFVNPGGVATNVEGLTVVNGELYVTGRFLQAASGGTFLGSVARWDGAAWQPVGAGFPPTVTGAIRLPVAHSFNGELLVSGNTLWRSPPPPQPFSHWVTIGRWNGSQWLPLGEGAVGDFNHPIHTIADYGGDLVFGGDFFSADGLPVNRLVIWRTCLSIDCPGDLDGDGVVGSSDLAIMLGSWGPAKGSPADLTGDDLVGSADLASLLGFWGPCP